MSLFSQTSYWHQSQPSLEELPVSTASETPLNISNRQLEDWSHRLQSMAYEAGDEGLNALESDLLDLRDDVVFELHQRVG